MIPLFASLAAAAIVYVATNPFVLINAVADPDVLRSNLGNSTAMYSTRSDGFEAIRSAWRILRAGLTGVWLWVGVALAIGGGIHACRRRRLPPPPAVLLLALVVVVSLQFVLLAAGKPAEYARFAIVPIAGLCLSAAATLAHLSRGTRHGDLLTPVLCGLCGLAMFAAFIGQEKRAGRLVATASLNRELEVRLADSEAGALIATRYEPAPWSTPPVDLFRSTLYLVPRDLAVGLKYDVLLSPTNLASQVGRDASEESVDWKYNGYAIEWRMLNSSSDSAGYRSASRTVPASRGR